MGPCASKPTTDKDTTVTLRPQAQGSAATTNKSGSNQNHFSNLNIRPELFVRPRTERISDFYELISPPLGSGGYGEVRKARSKETGEMRAVKIINRAAQSQEEQEILMNEVSVLKQMDHPHIIKIYEYFQDARCFYIVTELCTGGELFDKIVESKNLTEQMAADITRQMLSSVAYCHEKRIAHRDLKPENLLLLRKGDDMIKVIDFGLSRVFDPNKKMRHKTGTVYYIAPEVLRGEYDERCDVWSAGVITYLMLCGYPPFNGRSDDEILRKIIEGRFDFTRPIWQNISEQAKTFLKKLLTYDPAKRVPASEALQDPWLVKRDNKAAVGAPILSDAYSQLRSFRAESKLAQATYVFIVSYLSTNEEKEELVKLFKSLDKNNDGVLSREEMRDGFRSYYTDQDPDEMVNAIMQNVDVTKNNKVDYFEFIMAAMNRQKVLSRQRLEAAFKAFDQDGNGFITVQELKQILAEKNTGDDQSMWENLIREVDTNGDGQISLVEFKELSLIHI
eukprot:TRINITY_DN2839_c0_g1_i3.p1 TRINITY_DN2839_c0_g1~~TRINITY_DN2839_c0_g1_i3.p1  ORF type:complete len:506 (-),score=114.62 TRINITY_DN2839_c0_g1_i3:62-1579(-)